MPTCPLPACLKPAALALLASLAPLAWGEPLSATATIVGDDVGAARSEAVREMLWEAGLRAGAVVQSRSALIGGDLRESTVVSTTFRLKRFQIVSEEISQGQLRLSAEVEREPVGVAGCTPSLPLQNIGYGWEGIAGERASEADEQGGQALGAALEGELRARVAPYLQDAGAPRAEAIYRIGAALEQPGGASGAVLRLQLRGGAGDRLIRELRLPTGPAPLARQQDTHLGYALLRQWVPTAASLRLATDAARQLEEAIRCLPALLRIPPPAPDGSFSLPTRSPLDLGQRGLLLFFSAWPVKEGGAVDLLQADGYLTPERVDGQGVRFPGGARLPGRKYPVGGGYLLVL